MAPIALTRRASCTNTSAVLPTTEAFLLFPLAVALCHLSQRPSRVCCPPTELWQGRLTRNDFKRISQLIPVCRCRSRPATGDVRREKSACDRRLFAMLTKKLLDKSFVVGHVLAHETCHNGASLLGLLCNPYPYLIRWHTFQYASRKSNTET